MKRRGLPNDWVAILLFGIFDLLGGMFFLSGVTSISQLSLGDFIKTTIICLFFLDTSFMLIIYSLEKKAKAIKDKNETLSFSEFIYRIAAGIIISISLILSALMIPLFYMLIQRQGGTPNSNVFYILGIVILSYVIIAYFTFRKKHNKTIKMPDHN